MSYDFNLITGHFNDKISSHEFLELLCDLIVFVFVFFCKAQTTLNLCCHVFCYFKCKSGFFKQSLCICKWPGFLFNLCVILCKAGSMGLLKGSDYILTGKLD